MTWKIILAAAALAAGPALADNHEAGSVGSGVSEEARVNGTLHPGHIAVYATGRGSVTEDSFFNKPAMGFHMPEEGPMPGYAPGPGGWAETRRGGSFDR